MDRIAGVILKYRIVFFVLIGLLTGLFGHYAIKSKTDNSIEVWLKHNDPKLDYYYDFIDKFGDDEFLIIAIDGNDLFTGKKVKLINDIATSLEAVKGVRSVMSLASVYKDKLSSPYFKEILKRNKTKSVIEVFKEKILDDPMYINNVISSDGETTAIIAIVAKGSPESRGSLVKETREILRAVEIEDSNGPSQPPLQEVIDKVNGPQKDFFLAGPSIVNTELDRMSQKDMRTFTPVMFAVALIILLALFNNISGILIPAITISINIIWTVGLFVMFGNKMNMVSGMLIPLIFIISLATTVHILNRFYQEVKITGDRRESMLKTVKHISVPCFLMCVTTSIGFLSLIASDVTPVKTTGIFMAAGIMMSFIVCITLVPGMLSLFPEWMSRPFMNIQKDRESGHKEFRGLYGFIGRFVKNYTIYVFALSLLFVGVAIYGITKIDAESSIFESFPESSEITISTEHIEKELMGLIPMDIVVDAGKIGGVFQPDVLVNMENLQDHLKGIPEVTKSVSVADYVKYLNTLLNKDNPDSQVITKDKAIDYVKLASLHGDTIVKSLYTEDYNEGRVSVRMKNVGSSRYQAIVNDIEGFIKANFPLNVVCTITGIVPLLMDMQGYLIESQIKTFTLAFILIFICIALLLKSARIGMMSMIPNLVPIAVTLGVMGYVGINLDVATIMIASVAIGISVDDTIHFLYRFKEEFKKDGDHYLAIQRTLSGVGRALIFTTIVATCGFLVFSLSNFKAIQYFGLLTGITMVSAIFAVLLILPACILLFKPK
ncbi:MAG: RND family transporter [Candidatus Scalindua sp.]|jgi:predicted RND superfamily exporter protein|nr:RND family transporter [Candidatus Scalindua sp.]MBT6053087.1 RND family transporter [Candidatus Scalindua sp.]MBT6228741.1 RND family transporter [Candidatus Scalindua sp.]MBT6560894.1 RND family transporter [Candidatus Scalindua sp.]MBT7211834.1 RND family transporter [Candidatus Scalindua sp.]